MSIRGLFYAAGITCALLLTPPLLAAELHVVSCGGFAVALKRSRQSGRYRLAAEHRDQLTGAHPWATRRAPCRSVSRGEKIDVVIMVGYALDKLVEQGKVASADDIALARSGIGVVVKQGAPAPDVSTVDALKQALLAARSIAYSDSASGVYIEREMFKRMGIEDQVRGKAHMNPGRAGRRSGGARGSRDRLPADQRAEADQRHPTLVGPLPPPLQLYTVFSAGVLEDSHDKELGARADPLFGRAVRGGCDQGQRHGAAW